MILGIQAFQVPLVVTLTLRSWAPCLHAKAQAAMGAKFAVTAGSVAVISKVILVLLAAVDPGSEVATGLRIVLRMLLETPITLAP